MILLACIAAACATAQVIPTFFARRDCDCGWKPIRWPGTFENAVLWQEILEYLSGDLELTAAIQT
jgi:hypothetical protein